MGMGLRNTAGNISRLAGESVRGAVSTVAQNVQDIIGSVAAAETNIWDGGFVGISTANADKLKQAINKYIEDSQDIIDGFNEEANLEMAYKGQIQVGAQEFLRSVKELLQAYVTQMRKNLHEFEEVVEVYSQNDTDLGQQVNQQADEIRQNASKVRID